MNGEYWNGMVRRVAAEFGVDPSDEESDYILWERTAFPFGSPSQVEGQLREHFEGEFRAGHVGLMPEASPSPYSLAQQESQT